MVVPPGALHFFAEFEVDHTEAYGSLDRMAVYVAPTDLTDADVGCHEGRRIVFVDPDEVTGLPLTKGAGVILPAFLLSEVYKDMVAQDARY